VDEVLLNGRLRPIQRHLLLLLYGVGGESLLGLAALFGLLLNEVGVAAHLLVLGEHEVVADVHEARDALQEVGGGRAAHHQPPVVLLLLGVRLLPGVVQGSMQH
jgi:hypothetical protein